ncbi:Bromodomain-containing protein [Delphinella strobiligena]|nr:Bromodomain-containing protein [Delphinella strobiligena]
MDTPSSGTVRPRDDNETGDEPVAKRARTEEQASNETPGFKQPNPPTVATTNGDGAHAPAPASTNSGPRFSTEPMKAATKAVLLEKMKNTKKVKSATFFLKPVDYVSMNIPHYPSVIEHPMDLGTMEKKLKADQYPSLNDFVADFELIINNCITFNGAQHLVSISGQNLRAYFMKQMETVPTGSSVKDIAHIARPVTKKTSSPKPPPARRESRVTNTVPGAARPPTDSSTFALLPGGTPMIRRDSSAARPKRAIQAPQRDLPYNQVKPKRKENQMGLKFCDHILEEFRKPRSHKLTAAFLLPVDPVALNIPMYFKIVKRPMDLQTMTNKLKTGHYGTADEFKADFELMLENCFLFNPPGNIVYDQGKELQAAFEREWSKKDAWIKKNTPQSQRASPASDVESDGDDSDGEEEADVDGNEATIAMLREQLVNMQQTIASIAGGAKPPKAAKKSKKASGSTAKPSKKASAPKPTIKAKPKKQRQVTYEEKQEISNATENMNDEQITKLTNIITENVPKYKDMDAEDVELEIDELPNDVQQKLLRYVRSIFPPKPQSDDGDANAIDDDYEPERPTARSGKKKHKPMKKHEQEARIKELQEQMYRLKGGLEPGKAAAVNPAATSQPDSSDDEDSESSEEE